MSDQHQDDLPVDFSRIALATEVSPEILERSRKNMAVLLQKLNEKKAIEVSESLGVSASTLSRYKSDPRCMFFMRLLAELELKIVPAEALVFIAPEQFR